MRGLRRVHRIEQAIAAMPIRSDLLKQSFELFRETGSLPDDVRLGGEVIRWAETGVDPTEYSDAMERQAATFRGIADQIRTGADDKFMRDLRREAVYGTGAVRQLARFLLEGMAENGEDPTGPVILKRGPPYPEWTCGSAAFSILGWPYSRVHASYHEQLRGVMAEYERIGKRVGELSHHKQDEWYERLVEATEEHQRTGVLPADPLLRTMMQLDAEFSTIGREGRAALLAERAGDESGCGPGAPVPDV